jgi:GNAT superfamily N-acetyltransferase
MAKNLVERKLTRAEVEQIWTIDRAEEIDAVYYFEEGGLALMPEHYDMRGWPSGEPEKNTPYLYDCYDRGGWFQGLFDGEQLVGVAVLESDFLGPQRDQLQLKFLYISQAYRKHGLGKMLFERSKEQARRLGARQLYISATPSENTVNFYFKLGCKVATEPEPDLYQLEPEDIHMVYDLE